MKNHLPFDKLCTQFFNQGFVQFSKSHHETHLIEQALAASSKLFGLSLETKQSFSTSDRLRHGDGWSIIRKQQNAERWHLSENTSPFMWPKELEDELKFMKLILKISKSKVISFAESLSARLSDQTLFEKIQTSTVRLRLLYYMSEQGLRMRPHVDSGILTLFAGESVNGLQYKDVNDGGWVNASLYSNWIIGCANTLSITQSIPAFEHRVLPSDYTARYSIAVFFHVEEGKYKTLPK